MIDYEEEYRVLFNTITEAIGILQRAQMESVSKIFFAQNTRLAKIVEDEDGVEMEDCPREDREMEDCPMERGEGMAPPDVEKEPETV